MIYHEERLVNRRVMASTIVQYMKMREPLIDMLWDLELSAFLPTPCLSRWLSISS